MTVPFRPVNDTWSESDFVLMRRAIVLGEAHNPHPNPRVGCVIVNGGGGVVGEGAHQADGADHAEVLALQAAGDEARGATAYVTLEPCAHFGRTPPCAAALLRAGIGRVFVATLDPDSRVAGKGLRTLAEGGVATSLGLLESEAIEFDRGYHHHRRFGRPYVRVLLTAAVPGGLSKAAGANLDAIRDRLDYVVGGAGDLLHHPSAHAVSLLDQLTAIGADGIVDLGVSDDPALVHELASAGLVDAVTMYTLSPEPAWGPMRSTRDFTVTEVLSIGPEYRIEAHRRMPDSDQP